MELLALLFDPRSLARPSSPEPGRDRTSPAKAKTIDGDDRVHTRIPLPSAGLLAILLSAWAEGLSLFTQRITSRSGGLEAENAPHERPSLTPCLAPCPRRSRQPRAD